MTMVKSPMPGACAAAFTVGFPKPRSASHVVSVHALLVGSVIVTKYAYNEVGQLATVCGTFLDVAVKALGTPSMISTLSC